jgi:ribonuclease P protein component
MNGPSATPTPSSGFSFPKSCRLLRPAEFRQVYDQGFRHQTPFFAAFCLPDPPDAPLHPSARIGFTIPKAVGKANIRNRIRRRLRELVRTRLLPHLPSRWRIVFNPRRSACEARRELLAAELDRLLSRLLKQP